MVTFLYLRKKKKKKKGYTNLNHKSNFYKTAAWLGVGQWFQNA